jgi:hypothetical protein
VSREQHSKAVADARRQALLVHARNVHLEAFNTSLLQARAADRNDPVTDDDAKQQAEVEKGHRSTLSRLARNNGTSPSKALAEATEMFETEMKSNLVAWTAELEVVQDMISDPDAYGHKLLDGRPMDVDQLKQGVIALQAIIAHASAALGLEDTPPNGSKRGSR